jgi:DNA-binding response OmpR family regulator
MVFAAPIPTMKNTRVLIVDDDPVIRRLLESFFRLKKWKVDLAFAADGREAMERATSFDPDLVLLDIDMPEKNGFDVCRFLRASARDPRSVIVAMTANASADRRSRMHKEGANELVAKPFRLSDLERRLPALSPRLLASA